MRQWVCQVVHATHATHACTHAIHAIHACHPPRSSCFFVPPLLVMLVLVLVLKVVLLSECVTPHSAHTSHASGCTQSRTPWQLALRAPRPHATSPSRPLLPSTTQETRVGHPGCLCCPGCPCCFCCLGCLGCLGGGLEWIRSRLQFVHRAVVTRSAKVAHRQHRTVRRTTVAIVAIVAGVPPTTTGVVPAMPRAIPHPARGCDCCGGGCLGLVLLAPLVLLMLMLLVLVLVLLLEMLVLLLVEVVGGSLLGLERMKRAWSDATDAKRPPPPLRR